MYVIIEQLLKDFEKKTETQRRIVHLGNPSKVYLMLLASFKFDPPPSRERGKITVKTGI